MVARSFLRRTLPVVVVFGGAASLCTAIATDSARAQAVAVNPYAPVPVATGGGVTAPRRTAADIARRARVVARAGTAEVTVGEVEDALRGATLADVQAYQTPDGQRAFVSNLLRRAALAREAERRGLLAGRLGYAALRAGRRAAVDLLVATDFDARGFETAPPPEPLAAPSERRRAIVFQSASRAAVSSWLRAVSGADYDNALRITAADSRGTTQDTDWFAAADETSQTPSLRAAIFALTNQGTTTPILPVPAEHAFAAAILVGVDPGTPPPSGDELMHQQAWAAREVALSSLLTRLRSEHLQLEEPSALHGVPFQNADTATAQRIEGRYVEPEVHSIPVTDVVPVPDEASPVAP